MSKSTRIKTAAKKASPTPKASTASSAADLRTSEIRDLIEFISKTGLNEVDIETKDLKLRVKRDPDQKILRSGAPAAGIPVAAATATTPPPAAGTKTESESPPSGKKTAEIKSPMIGTFYRSPNPDSQPFVSVGDKVTQGDTVCIIEAMKLFNEIESEVTGTIVKILVENSTPVEYDQPLYLVEVD